MEQQGLQGPRIALLIDFDNVILGVDDPPGFDAELVMNALRSRGVVVLGRAYGDWYRHNRHRRKLMEQGIELVETPAFGPVIKNSADIRIALDAFEIGMLQSHISEFCLVSGDSDFLPLIKRLQLLGKSVVVIAGNKFTSALIRQNCNEYISYENLLAESVGATEDATTLDGAFALLKRTISTMDERGQDARSSSVKQMMLQLNPVFSERSFGCHQFKQFLDKACAKGIIRLDRRDSNSGEYQVMLLDENGHGIHEEHEIVPKEKHLISDLEIAPVHATRKPHTRSPKPAKEDTEEAKETSVEDEIHQNASTVPPSRRGRLKFSGRTWRGGGTSVNTERNNEEKPAEDLKSENSEVKNVPESFVKADENIKSASPQQQSSEREFPATEKPEEVAKSASAEKPKSKTTRRRKATTSSSKDNSKSASETQEASSGKAEKPAEEKPKKAKAPKSTSKKTQGNESEEKSQKPVRRRRTTSKRSDTDVPNQETTPAE